MEFQILQGDSLEMLKTLPDNSVDCCVTSPPYFGLRNYGYDGQIGLEETPEQYIQKIVEIFREVRRVMKDDGTLWLNIGDSYAGSAKGSNGAGAHSTDRSISSDYMQKATGPLKRAKTPGIKRKELIGIPWLLAFALRQDGWYLRQDIIWYKPNAMPESVKDRCTKSHEYIFLMSKSERYHFDYEAIKEPCVGFDKSSPRGSKGTLTQNAGRRKGNSRSFRGGGAYTNKQSFNNSADIRRETHGNTPNESGKRNRRSVWSVATQGYKGAHFATFPEKLAEPCVLAGARPGGTVLDPFSGSGTTGAVAIRNGRNYIGIEINPEYVELSEIRLEKEAKI